MMDMILQTFRKKKNVFIFTFYNNFTIINEFFIEQENCLNVRVVP